MELQACSLFVRVVSLSKPTRSFFIQVTIYTRYRDGYLLLHLSLSPTLQPPSRFRVIVSSIIPPADAGRREPPYKGHFPRRFLL